MKSNLNKRIKTIHLTFYHKVNFDIYNYSLIALKKIDNEFIFIIASNFQWKFINIYKLTYNLLEIKIHLLLLWLNFIAENYNILVNKKSKHFWYELLDFLLTNLNDITLLLIKQNIF
jgi:hypothetical protein